ncbi:MAG: YkgJ family cysteine cluster protein [Candidatus Abyssubacteria bacterium]
MKELENLKETILRDAPRFTETDKFRFSCHKGLNCFTQCCADVTIFLTPYDIIRMKNRLGISSDEFLAAYTFVPFTEQQKVPVIVLKMGDDEQKTCPFLTPEGCSIYEDRPWACRMYPLGLASPSEDGSAIKQQFYFVMQEGNCCGFSEDKEWTVAEWIENQGVTLYNQMGESFKGITLHEFFRTGGRLEPEKMEMLYMGCYHLDKFRRFVFESKFLECFDIDPELVARIRSDDVELMEFAFQWLKFALFNEPTVKIRGSVLEAKRQKLLGKEQPK